MVDFSDAMTLSADPQTGKQVVTRSRLQGYWNAVAAALNALDGDVAFTSVDQSFETRTAFAAASIAGAGTTINTVVTGGYASAGDGGGARYKHVASEPAHAGKVQSADGAWWEVLPGENGYNVLTFGADGTGVADSTAAIQGCMDALDATAGGDIFFPRGTYIVSPQDVATALGTARLCLPITKKNMRFVGAGRRVSIIKVADGSGNFGGIFNVPVGELDGTLNTDTSGCEWRHLGFDANIANNPIAAAGDMQIDQGGVNSWRAAIRSYRGHDMAVEDCAFKDFYIGVAFVTKPDITCVDHVENIRVVGNKFDIAVASPGGLDFDATQIHLAGNNMLVMGNEIEGGNPDYFLSRTAIQALGDQVTVTANIIDKFYRGILVGQFTIPQVCTAIVVSGNTIKHCNGGIELSAAANTVVLSGTGLKNVQIFGNTIQANKVAFKRVAADTETPYGIKVYQASDLAFEDIDISDNIIDLGNWTTDGGHGIDFSTTGGTEISKVIRIGRNTVRGAPRASINFGVGAGSQIVSVDDNTLVNPGGRNLGTAGNNAAVRVTGVIERMKVTGNQYNDDRGTHLISAGLYLSVNADSDTVRSIGNQLFVLDGTAIPIVETANSNVAPLIQETVQTFVKPTLPVQFGSRVAEISTGLTYKQMRATAVTTWIEEGVASPAQITSDQNDYNPTTKAEVWRLSSDAARTITGIVSNGVDGRKLTIINVGSSNIVIAHMSASSASANQVRSGTGANITLGAHDTVHLIYDAIDTKWRVLSAWV